MPRVSSYVLNVLAEAGRSAGVAVEPLLERFGLTPGQLRDRELRVGCGVAFGLTEAISEACRDPHFGLNSAATLQPEAAGVVGHLALSARSPWEALSAYYRFQRVMGDGLLLECTETGADTVLMLRRHPDLGRPVPEGTVEHLMANMCRMARRLGVPVPPSRVSFRHGGCPPWRDYELAFDGAPVRFEADEDALAYPTAELRRPTRTTDPGLFEYLEARAQVLLDRVGCTGVLAQRVSAELLRQLRVQRPTLDSVARALALSRRSLQRGLAAEGHSFQKLLDRARCELAKHHLATSPGPVLEVGYLLGFQDESAFRKAFRRWTGQSPAAYRAAVAAAY